MLALIAGTGALPAELVFRLAGQGIAPLICEMEGFAPDVPAGLDRLRFRLEHLGSLLEALRARDVTEICLCGAVRRPWIDPTVVDERTAPLVARLVAAMGQGDDGALRALMRLLEDEGFSIRAAHEIAPDLLPPEGEPHPELAADAERGEAVLRALAAADIGQACVIGAGQVLAVETAFGTGWMLASLKGQARGAMLVKAPKPGQDRRADLPVIGSDTVRAAQSAGLEAIVIEAGGVMVLDRPEVGRLCAEAGITLWVRPRGGA